MTRCVNRTFLPSMFVRSVGRRCRDGFGFGPSHARQIPRCGAPRRPGLKITILLDGHWLHRPVARTFRNVEWTGDGGQVCPVLVASVNSNAPSSRKQRPDGIDNTADTYRATCPGRVGCRTSRAMREAGPTRDSFATVLECLSSQRLTERGNQTARRSWNLLLTTMGGFQLGCSLRTFRGRMLRQGPLSDGIGCPLPPQTRRRFSRDIARILVPRPILAIGSLAQRVRALRTSMEHRWLGAKVG